MQLDDLGMLKGVSEPQISPDGRWIAYQVSTTDYDADRVTGEIVVRSLDGESLRTIVGGSSPRWSPDGGTLAYRGSGERRSGLWLYDFASGDHRFLTEVHTTDHFLGHQAQKNFEWSPDGRFIAFVGAEPPGPEPVSDVRVYKRILYKTRTSFSDDRLTHVWIVDVQSSRVRVLTPGTFDEHSISWSPDGERIAFVSNHSEDPDANYSDDLWTVDVSSGEVTRVTHTEAAELSPRWSPDGRYLAFLGWTRPLNTKDSPAEDTQLFLISPSGGAVRNLTGPLNRR
ncbi:MAG: PD40 domain-containing protein, partial [Gemmatimonadetes bacterium]|nr:PD40 domain-containing protein [Gemmatimonadota bacterium]